MAQLVKVFARQTWGLEFGSPAHTYKLESQCQRDRDGWMHGAFRAASPAELCAPGLRDYVSKHKRLRRHTTSPCAELLRKMLHVNLWPPCLYIYAQKNTWTHTWSTHTLTNTHRAVTWHRIKNTNATFECTFYIPLTSYSKIKTKGDERSKTLKSNAHWGKLCQECIKLMT